MSRPVSPLALILSPPYGWIFAALWGALWGSFFNVCIHRVGLYESVVRPRSRCPSCGAAIGALDNVPILSWLVLGGRCRRCKAGISVRYPLVEALSAGLAVAVFARFASGIEADPVALLARFFVYFGFAGALVVLAGIDLDHKLLPDRITMPAIPIFVLCGILMREVPPDELLLGCVIGYGLVAVTAELAYLALGREGMGYGDAKLLAMIGALCGWRGAVATFFGAPFFGLVIAVPILIARRRGTFGVEIPYGPFLVAAALAYLFFGHLVPPPLTFVAGGAR